MVSLKNQILQLYQDWYDNHTFNIWTDYKESAKQFDKLLMQIYNLVKNYEGE